MNQEEQNNPLESELIESPKVVRKVAALAGLATMFDEMMSRGGSKLRQQMDLRSKSNPHNFDRFETDGFVTYSLNQAAHDAKYAKWLKRNSK